MKEAVANLLVQKLDVNVDIDEQQPAAEAVRKTLDSRAADIYRIEAQLNKMDNIRSPTAGTGTDVNSPG